MKNLKTIITVLAISLSTVFTANTLDKKTIKKNINNELRTEIISLFGDKIPLKVKQESIAEVAFMVNKNNELVVVSVETKVAGLNSYVKNKLNYKKLSVKGIAKGEIYKMPIKIKKSK